MAIGDVKASGGLKTQLISDNSSEITSRAMSGLGEAIDRLAQAGFSYLNSKTDLEAVYDRRAQASKGLELDTQLLQYQKERAIEFAEFSRARSANPAGMTKDYDAAVAVKEAEFLKTVPPRFQEEVKAKLAQDRATRVASAFSAELTLLDTADTHNLNTSLNALGSAVKGGGATLEDAQASWEEMVTKTALPAEDKKQFIERGRATLQGLEFGTIIERGAKGFGVVRDGTDGSDVVAAGLPAGDRAVLNAIAKNEAPGYDVWNGGTKFTGYEDHPAAFGKAPGESTAAGRYQFILGTWRAASAAYEKKYGVKVPNFSPEWQDRVAANWAEVQFNRHYSGATYREILASGDPTKLLRIRDVLGKPRSANPNDLEWAGLGTMSDAQFIEMITGEKGFAGGGTGPEGMPNPWTDPRFSDLSLENKLGFANAAGAAAEHARLALASSLTLERKQFLEDVYNAGYSNQPGVLEALQKGGNWDAEAQARYNAGQAVFREGERSVGAVQQTLSEGSPLSAEQGKAFGQWFGAGDDGFAGIVGGNSEAYKRLGGAVATARLFPDGSSDAFMAAIGNPKTAPNALAFLAAAMAGDSSILKRSGFDNDLAAKVQLYKNLAGRVASPEAAYADYSKVMETKDRTGMSDAQLTTEAYKSFTEAYPTSQEILGKWNGWFSYTPDITGNPALEGQLMGAAGLAYRDGFMKTGTAEGAEAYMQTALGNMFGVSQTQKASVSSRTLLAGAAALALGPMAAVGLGPVVAGVGLDDGAGTKTRPTLMQWPPEKYYPAADADYGYLYSGIGDFAEAAGAQRNGAVLIPDEQTEREVRSNKPPTYKVMGKGEFGEAVVLPGRFGGEELMRSATDSIRETAAVENSLAYINEYSQQEQELLGAIDRRAELEFQPKAFQDRLGTLGEDAALSTELFEVRQKKHAAIVSAIEQGHLAPEVILSDKNVAETAKSFAQGFAERLATDTALSQRISQAILEVPEADLPGVLSKLVARELKVPAELADLISIELLGAK